MASPTSPPRSRRAALLGLVGWLLLCYGVSALAGLVQSDWYQTLQRPAWAPPGWVFGAVWSVLYVLLGLALAQILNARGARGQALAVSLFAGQLVLNLAWSPTFFAAHKVTLALIIVLAMLALAVATTFAFFRIRKPSAWMMLPYLVWLCFATVLNYQVLKLNPDAESMKPASPKTQIIL